MGRSATEEDAWRRSLDLAGTFLRVNDPEALYEWYERHFGLVRAQGSFAFPASTQRAQVVFAFFGQEDPYFPPTQKAMINLQVDDLDGVLDRLIGEMAQFWAESPSV